MMLMMNPAVDKYPNAHSEHKGSSDLRPYTGIGIGELSWYNSAVSQVSIPALMDVEIAFAHRPEMPSKTTTIKTTPSTTTTTTTHSYMC